ncbi:MAG: hypothetical protein OES46_21275 [Gammaproteobacteria bacterium]|nr:hypothetical protein [Gammaproteobacteria bacterium]
MSISESFTGVGAGTKTLVLNKKPVNVSVVGLSAGVGTVELQRRNLAGVWVVAKSMVEDTEEVVISGHKGQLYRFNCATHTSGTFNCELGG